MQYKTGLLPSPEPPRLLLGTYLLPALLPPVPEPFGHQNLYPSRGWGMLDNDRIGNCTVAGADHVCMIYKAAVKNPTRFTDADAREDYFAITGGQDSGADMVVVARYWQETGFRDAFGKRHKILAYLHSNPKHLDRHDAACWLFDAVGLGVAVGNEEEEAFNRGEPWDNPNSTVAGYHYVPYVGKDKNFRYVITWGGLQPVTESWYRAKVNEVVPMLSDENLIEGKSLEGFDLERLKADLLATRN